MEVSYLSNHCPEGRSESPVSGHLQANLFPASIFLFLYFFSTPLFSTDIKLIGFIIAGRFLSRDVECCVFRQRFLVLILQVLLCRPACGSCCELTTVIWAVKIKKRLKFKRLSPFSFKTRQKFSKLTKWPTLMFELCKMREDNLFFF